MRRMRSAAMAVLCYASVSVAEDDFVWPGEACTVDGPNCTDGYTCVKSTIVQYMDSFALCTEMDSACKCIELLPGPQARTDVQPWDSCMPKGRRCVDGYYCAMPETVLTGLCPDCVIAPCSGTARCYCLNVRYRPPGKSLEAGVFPGLGRIGDDASASAAPWGDEPAAVENGLGTAAVAALDTRPDNGAVPESDDRPEAFGRVVSRGFLDARSP
mmetsp:Transcript_119617/g.343612  ORF Transcript_119617/g.343612 Transcript_119617/m.343612 type:complete len:214 (-) Transcript_119617:108-749(-)